MKPIGDFNRSLGYRDFVRVVVNEMISVASDCDITKEFSLTACIASQILVNPFIIFVCAANNMYILGYMRTTLNCGVINDIFSVIQNRV